MVTEEQKQQLDAMFKFKCGDIVRHMVGEDATDQYYTRRDMHRMIVLERVLQQCPGGVQLWYTARIVGSSGGFSEKLSRVLECELVASEPFKAEKNE